MFKCLYETAQSMLRLTSLRHVTSFLISKFSCSIPFRFGICHRSVESYRSTCNEQVIDIDANAPPGIGVAALTNFVFTRDPVHALRARAPARSTCDSLGQARNPRTKWKRFRRFFFSCGSLVSVPFHPLLPLVLFVYSARLTPAAPNRERRNRVQQLKRSCRRVRGI